jgi:hypothetical protein
MLYEFLEEHGVDVPQDHSNWRPWKHLPTPPEESDVKDDFRALYLFGNPMNAVLSVFRRDYQRWHFRNMTGDFEGWSDEMEHLDGFLEQESDPFRMDEHFRTWTTAERSYPIMLLHFDALWQHLPELFSFFGVPYRLREAFPERRERHSDWRDEPDDTREPLEALYGDLHRDVQQAPAVDVI